MKKLKERCGAALLEILVSIAILGLLLVPISSGILMSFRINERSNEIMQARLAVSSAVETIMAVGVENYTPDAVLNVSNTNNGTYHAVTVEHKTFTDISVTINVRSGDVRTPESVPGGGV